MLLKLSLLKSIPRLWSTPTHLSFLNLPWLQPLRYPIFPFLYLLSAMNFTVKFDFYTAKSYFQIFLVSLVLLMSMCAKTIWNRFIRNFAFVCFLKECDSLLLYLMNHSFLTMMLFQLVEESMVKLDRICRQANVMLIFARSYGLTGLVRISVKVTCYSLHYLHFHPIYRQLFHLGGMDISLIQLDISREKSGISIEFYVGLEELLKSFTRIQCLDDKQRKRS